MARKTQTRTSSRVNRRSCQWEIASEFEPGTCLQKCYHYTCLLSVNAFIRRTERKLQVNAFCRRKIGSSSTAGYTQYALSPLSKARYVFCSYFDVLPSPTFWFSPFTDLKQNHLLAANWIFAIVNRRIPNARLHCQRLALPNSATDRGVAALIYLPRRSLFTLRLYRINVSISHPVCFGYKFSITALLLHGEFIIRGVPHMWCLYLDVRAPSNFKCIPDCAVGVWSQEKPWRHRTLWTVPDCFDKYRTGSDRDMREKGGQN